MNEPITTFFRDMINKSQSLVFIFHLFWSSILLFRLMVRFLMYRQAHEMDTNGRSNGNFSAVNSYQLGAKNYSHPRINGGNRTSHNIPKKPDDRRGKDKHTNPKHIQSNHKHSNNNPKKNNMATSKRSISNSNSFNNDTSKNIKTSSFASKFVGSFFAQPDKKGYTKIKHEAIPIPKYMLQTQTLFESSSFNPHPWDRKNQQMLIARESEFDGDPQILFQEFQEDRKKERETIEKLGLVDKENAKKSLSAAISFRGSCQDMCPVYQRVEREYKNQVSSWEKDPTLGRISRKYAIKTFMRPSGQPPSLPSDVRPPKVLSSTLDYIIDNLLLKLPASQSFIWDRTRSIRQDFTFQNNYSGIESIDCHERICRIHILCLHVMAGANDPDYQQQQEIEQLNNSMQTLTHMYDDVRSRGGFCANEAEFRAYELISKIDDTELDRNLQRLPEYVISSPILQRALMLRGLILQGVGRFDLYTTFFHAVLCKQTPFLLACLTEIHFNRVRFNALKMMSRALHSKAKSLPNARTMASNLGFDTVDQFLETCKLYSIPVIYDDDDTSAKVEVTAMKGNFKHAQKPPYTVSIDQIPHPKNYKDIVNSGKPNYELQLKSSKNVEQIARDSFQSGKKSTELINSILEGTTDRINIKVDIEDSPPSNAKFDYSKAELPILSNTVKPVITPSNTSSTYKPTATLPALSSTLPKEVSTSPFKFSQPEHTPSRPILNFNPEPKQSPVSNLNLFKSEPKQDLHPTVDLPKREAAPKLLVEEDNFKTASLMLTNDMIKEILAKITPKMLEVVRKRQREAKRSQKSRKIDILSHELYRAFVREQEYLAILKIRADAFRETSLKKSLIKKFKKVAKLSMDRHRIKNDKKNEIEMFRQSIASPSAPLTRMSVPITTCSTFSFDTTGQINLNALASKHALSSKSELLLVVKNQNDRSTKWIAQKLGMEHNKTDQYFVHGQLHIRYLPDDLKPSLDFKYCNFVVIQIGTTDEDMKKGKDVRECLAADLKVFKKVMHYLLEYRKDQYTGIILIFLSRAQSQPLDEIATLFNLAEINNHYSNVDVHITDLSGIYSFDYRLMKERMSLGISELFKDQKNKSQPQEKKIVPKFPKISKPKKSSNEYKRCDPNKLSYIKSQLSDTGKSIFRVRLKRRRLSKEDESSGFEDSKITRPEISLLSMNSAPVTTSHFYMSPGRSTSQGVSTQQNEREKQISDLTILADSILNDS